MIDRAEVNRALAKAIAYKNCGRDQDAELWARELVRLLECAAIIDPGYERFVERRGLVAA